MPALIAPSPITAMARPGLSASLLATAKPSAAEMLVELCAAPNGSYSLSAALGEAAKAPALPNGADPVAAAGDDLVRIGIGGRRPRSVCRPACRTHNGSQRSARPRRGPSPDARPTATPPKSSPREARRQAAAAGTSPACGYRRGIGPGREAAFRDGRTWRRTYP